MEGYGRTNEEVMIIGIEQHKKLRKLGFPMVESYKDENTGQDITYTFPMSYNESEMRFPKLRGDITVSEALDWIRENHKGLFLSVRFNSYPKPCYVGRVDHLPKFNCTETKSFESHSDCNSALLDAVLTYLEENNHGNKF